MAKKTIRDAIKGLPRRHAELIIRAFNATKAMDVYEGDLSLYLQVIVQTLEENFEKMYVMKSAATTMKSILEANF
ncbi:MAG: hypothetical protein KAR39_13105 [Thermoplasmata archaeon]|nr:hypothetical protein [Thermoplasmata archaeon]